MASIVENNKTEKLKYCPVCEKEVKLVKNKHIVIWVIISFGFFFLISLLGMLSFRAKLVSGLGITTFGFLIGLIITPFLIPADSCPNCYKQLEKTNRLPKLLKRKNSPPK